MTTHRIILLALAGALAACSAKRTAAPGKAQGRPGFEPDIRGARFASASGVDDVLFEYDAHRLTPETLASLKRNAELLKLNPDLQILVEGHCDDRGTVEYNLALGQKRAKAVREYYVSLGVPGERVATISYGKERPVCPETTEDCRKLNRRAEHKARNVLAADAKTKP